MSFKKYIYEFIKCFLFCFILLFTIWGIAFWEFNIDIRSWSIVKRVVIIIVPMLLALCGSGILKTKEREDLKLAIPPP